MPSPSERHLVENEQLIQARNENFKNALKKFYSPDRTAVHEKMNFFCECSDLQCKGYVVLSISQYEAIHARDDRFVIMPKHDLPKVEKIVDHTAGYDIVEKYTLTP